MTHISPFTLPNNGPTFQMVAVPGTGSGFFTMGSPEDEPERFDRETQHPVKLSDFHMGEFPVTQELWTAVMGASASGIKFGFKGERRPVESVSWFDAAVFCNVLNTLLGKKPCYHSKKGDLFGWDIKKGAWYLPNEGEITCDFTPGSFRLPTESEWEYAARGGHFAPALQQSPERDYRYAGSDQLEQVGWFHKNSDGQTNDVGLLLPNALGLYDMSGNVLEWCYDWHGNYSTKKEPEHNPKGAEQGAYRVLRGGGWGSNSLYCRSAYRYGPGPDYRYDYIGFRLALQ